MIIDSSAMLALIQGAPEANDLVSHLTNGDNNRIPAPSAAECLIVLTHRYGHLGRTLYERTRQEFAITTAEFTETHAITTLRAYLEYSTTGLSYTDLMAYAVASDISEPLLTTEPAFNHTALTFTGPLGTWPTKQPQVAQPITPTDQPKQP